MVMLLVGLLACSCYCCCALKNRQCSGICIKKSLILKKIDKILLS
jgi:hypothetical protein